MPNHQTDQSHLALAEEYNMKTPTLTLGVVFGAALAVSGAAQATVSHVFVSNSGDATVSVVQCVTSKGKEPIKCREKERTDVGFNFSWPANQYDGHPAWWWTGLSGEVVGVKAKASLSPLDDADRSEASLERPTLIVSVRGQFAMDRLKKHFLSEIRGAAMQACGAPAEVRLNLEEPEARQPPYTRRQSS